MSRLEKLYIAAVGMITPVGFDSEMTAASVKAKINIYQNSMYRNSRLDPTKMALIPKDALPPIDEEIEIPNNYNQWAKHLLRIAHAGMNEVIEQFPGEEVLPFILSCPEGHPKVLGSLPEDFMYYLAKQSKAPIDLERCRMMTSGRSGMIEAIKLAFDFFTKYENEYLLIGGVESFKRSELLAQLEIDKRLLSDIESDGFVPGEAASFILVTKNKHDALKNDNGLISISNPGISAEEGHLYSEEVYQGNGLAQAFQQALASNQEKDDTKFLYASLNGESFWAKEMGVALMRNSGKIGADIQIEHPSDCYGDIGAATAGVLMGLATKSMLSQDDNCSSLIYCSSDRAPRAAVKVSLEKLS